MKTRIAARRQYCALFCLLALPVSAPAAGHALDLYVKTPDGAYEFHEVNHHAFPGGSVHILAMTSQRWLTGHEVDRPLWKHWLNLVIPAEPRRHTALLFISGGSNRDAAPHTVDAKFRRIAAATGAVVAELRMVPNQPLRFAGDTVDRQEDEIIAYCWDKYLHGGGARWLPRLPMTKAAVRAMDTVSSFLAEKGIEVHKFVVAGASKRGWTTWTTAAVDPRVVAIAPMVIDVLNLEKSMTHHYRAYGFWAPAVGDYARQGVMGWMGSEAFRRLLREVDPYEFRDRFQMPKYLIDAGGDQFFLPDSSQFYFADLPGEKYLRYVPNTDHSLDGSDVLDSFTAWLIRILDGRPRPRFQWKFSPDGGIVVRATDRPARVTLWQASNRKARDFRLETIGKKWRPTPLEARDGVYTASVARPEHGWVACFVELTYRDGKFPLKLTTPVRVKPDTLPYAAPPQNR